MVDIENLKKVKNNIENFNKQQQIDILKLLVKNNTNISENLNGTFINLSELDYSIILELQNYIDFVNTQDKNLNNVEIKKKILEKQFFETS